MTWKLSLAGHVARFRVIAAVATGLLVVSAPARAQGATVEGTWLVQVTLRNCATQAPMGTFPSLVTFGKDGSITESPGSTAFAPGQRSPGHGEWEHAGHGTFSQRMIALVLFTTPPNLPTSPGFEAGWQTVEHTITMTDADNITSSGTNHFYRANGELYRSGCSTAVGRRFE
jgi:hypothetical protein